jgi:hypothetical protein
LEISIEQNPESWNIETIKEIYIIYADAVGMLKHRNGKFTLGKPPLLS